MQSAGSYAILKKDGPGRAPRGLEGAPWKTICGSTLCQYFPFCAATASTRDPLRAALDDCAEFRLAVPFIGAMNSGKSSLLNALAGLPLLPVGITATTAVPTGLVFGENGAFAQRGGALLRSALGTCARESTLPA